MKVERRTRRRLVFGAAALPVAGLAGCVVTPYGPYYRPSTDGPATYKGAWCQGVAGPRTVVELELAPGVALTARADRGFAERDLRELPLRLSLALPPTEPARFLGDHVRIVEAGGRRSLGTVREIHTYRYATFPARAWIDPARVRPSGAVGTPLKADEPHGRARLRVAVEPGFTQDRLRIVGLVIDRDGVPSKMPSIDLARPASKASPRDYRSAGLHAQLEARAAACRRDTPQRACDNIVEYSSIGFLEDTADARWSGRWVLVGDGAAARVDGDIEYAPRSPGRWRLAADTLEVHGAGPVRRAQVVQVALALNDRVALDTPLFAGAVDGSAPAQLTIEALLPAAPPDFEVILPDLQLGGRRLAIPPLRFERRAFDGGIEPFNC
jgi:hypothetical protein